MTLPELIDLVQKVGVPTVFAGFLLWRIEPLLKELIAVTRDVSDPDKTAARLKPVMDAQARQIINEVAHETRAAVQPVLIAMRGCGHRVRTRDDEP